ncbi:hypothetical protein Y032_0091g2467 [Ancylostoma ceylanicum]|nr:hypothetical protein Y032_0091g2467 [Ancylostoma ceylanicum]
MIPFRRFAHCPRSRHSLHQPLPHPPSSRTSQAPKTYKRIGIGQSSSYRRPPDLRDTIDAKSKKEERQLSEVDRARGKSKKCDNNTIEKTASSASVQPADRALHVLVQALVCTTDHVFEHRFAYYLIIPRAGTAEVQLAYLRVAACSN